MLVRILRLLLGLRSVSRRVAKSYYRYTRALQTGRTIGNETARLRELREDFESDLERVRTLSFDWSDATADEKHAADGIRSLSKSDPKSWQSGELNQSLEDWLTLTDDSDKEIDFDDIKWSEDDIQSVEDALRKFRKTFGDKGVTALEKKIEEIKRRYAEDPDRILAEIDDSYILVRDSLAGVVDKGVIDAGREVIDNMIGRDKLATRFARGVRENPCYFCSMLASRGFVYYSERAALAGWHPNCHCYPIVRMSSDPKWPSRNAYYNDMWYEHGGTIKLWRKWITAERRRKGLKV